MLSSRERKRQALDRNRKLRREQAAVKARREALEQYMARWYEENDAIRAENIKRGKRCGVTVLVVVVLVCAVIIEGVYLL